MFSMGNHIWYPHRGCRNLVLPYRIFSDDLKPADSKSYGVGVNFARPVPESGTSVDEPVIEKAEFIDIGTCVDTGIIQYRFVGYTGTNIDKYLQRLREEVVNDVKSKLFTEINTLRYCGGLQEEIYTSASKTDTDDTEISQLASDSGVSIQNALGFNKETETPNTNTEITVVSADMDTSVDEDGGARGDTEVSAEKASNSFTYLAFWNINNCNTVSPRNLYLNLAHNTDSYRNLSQRPVRYFPSVESEYRLYQNPGEYIIVPGGHGYGRVEKNPNWRPGYSGKPEWWSKVVSWSCRLCVVGMLVLLGYSLYGKYKDTRLYE